MSLKSETLKLFGYPIKQSKNTEQINELLNQLDRDIISVTSFYLLAGKEINTLKERISHV